MADLPVLASNTQRVDSDNSSFAEGFVKTLNAQTQTLVELKDSSLGILKATLSMKDTLEANASAANLDSSTVEGNIQKKKDDGLSGKFSDMLDSMQDAFDGLSGGTKSLLGIGALLAGLALLNTFSDELAEMIAPILKFFNESFLPNLKELNQIILDQPGGYLTLLGAAGLTKTMFDIFGKGGKIAKVIDDTVDGVKVLKQADLLDDLAVRKVGWAQRLRIAFTGRLTGLFGRIGGTFSSIGASLRALGLTLVDDLALALKNLTPTWLRVLKLQLVGGETIYPIVKGGGKQIGIVGKVSQGIQSIVASIKGLNPFAKLGEALKTLTPTWTKVLKLQILGGETIYPITKGGGKQIGIVGKVSQSIQKVVTSIKGLNPFAGLGASLKTLGASWKLALGGAMFGAAAGPAGAGAKAGVLGKITNAITRIALIVKGIFSPASILGRFTSKIKGIFAIIGKALGFVSKLTGLTSFLKLGLSLGKAIPVVGQIIMVLTGIFGFIKGAIEGFKTGGILGAIKGGLIGLYDGLIGSFLNLIADIIGWVFKKLGFTRLGEFFSNLNFNFDGIMNGIMWVIDKIKGAFHMVVNGLKRMANGVIKAINFVLPGRFEIDEFEITPYKSTYEPRTTTASEGMDVSDIPTISENTTRADTGSVDLAALQAGATSDMQNQDIQVSAAFKDIQQDGTISEADAQKLVDDFTREATPAEIAAAEATDNAKIDALVAAEMKRLELEADAEIARSGGAVQIYDTSSKSTLNNTTQVSNALSVDASDLVAAKLNLMLPAFN